MLIYLLGFYVLVQFSWWAYMLVNLNADVYNLNLETLVNSEYPAPEQLIQKAELDQKLSHRIWMVLGEGAVFVFILLLGFWAVRNSITQELQLAEQQKNFLLSITHELKSPLAAIKLQLQTLNSRDLPVEKQKQLYARALVDSNRLEKLVENLLLVNKIESGRLPLSKTGVNISDLLNRLIKQGYPQMLESGRLKAEIASDLMVNADEMAIESIVINLVDNALKYGGETEVIVCLSSFDKSNLEFSVADFGAGIPVEEREKVFERFYRRGNEEVRQTKGTGIGLYLVKLLINSHHGSIFIEDNTPKGTKFVVRLPQKLT